MNNVAKIVVDKIQPEMSKSTLWIDLNESPNGGTLKIGDGTSWNLVGSMQKNQIVKNEALNIFGVSSGSTSNAQIVTSADSITKYKPGMQISYIPTVGNTSSIVSLNINNLGPFLIKKANSISGSDSMTEFAILPGIIAVFIFDGSNFRFLNPNS